MKKDKEVKSQPLIEVLDDGEEPALETLLEGLNTTGVDDDDDGPPKRKVTVSTRKLPPDVYYSSGDETLEQLMPYLIGPENTERVRILGRGRNVRPLGILRQGLAIAFETGGFDALGADGKRTGNDERPEHLDNRRLKAALGRSNYDRLLNHARARKVSNIAALKAGVKTALDRGAI